MRLRLLDLVRLTMANLREAMDRRCDVHIVELVVVFGNDIENCLYTAHEAKEFSV